MRNLVLLLLAAAGTVAVFRSCRESGESAAEPLNNVVRTARPADDGPEDGEVGLAAVELPPAAAEGDGAAPVAVSAKAESVPSAEPLRAAAIELSRTGRVGDLRQIEAMAEAEDTETADLARSLVAAADQDAKARRDGLQRIFLSGLVEGDDRHALYRRLLDANAATVLSPTRTDGVLEHVVASGDALFKICQRYGKERDLHLTPGLLRCANGLRSDVIQVGRKLKIPTEPVRIEISKGSMLLHLYLGDALVREYAVGIGKEGRTPSGSFTICSRLEKAPWRDPESGRILMFGDPDYAIGTRWLGFADAQGERTDLGIHGTSEPESIGRAESLGCIRMRNEEVEELFDLLATGVTVLIADDA